MTIAVCLKLVDTRPELDASGTIHDPDARFTGVSAADQAALEWALRCADAWGDDVHVATAGPAAADRILRDALATGAASATRVHLPMGAPSDVVAGALAPLLEQARLVWCGDHSLDRGTGSVPAYLAASLGCAQALGLVDIALDADGPGPADDGPGLADDGPGVAALRRLDGGRRERLRVSSPAVLSVEGSTALLRRAPLAATLRAAAATISTIPGPPLAEHTHRPTRPFRPRPRTLAPPDGATSLDRIRALTDSGGDVVGGETVVLDPPAAAERILDSLRAWGYR